MSLLRKRWRKLAEAKPGSLSRAVFLDRDGVIIEDTGHPHGPRQVHFLPRVADAIRILNERNFKVVVVSNQAGVAKGLYSEDEVRLTNDYISSSLAREGARIDSFYYCPHHVNGIIERYRVECDCRKPRTGMLVKASRELGIDLPGSYMIGDHESDIEAGYRAKCTTIWVRGANGVAARPLSSQHHQYVADDLFGAVAWLLNRQQERSQSIKGDGQKSE